MTSHPQAFDDREGLLRVVVDSGTEVVQGSTRLKAATAAHRVMQRASTLCALQLGSIYRGRMVEMRPTNDKLRRRAATIVSDLGEVDRIRAAKLLVASGDDIKAAIVCAWFGVGPEEAADRLEGVGRRLEALEARRR